MSRIVIVGAGQAAASAMVALRQHGFDGSITLIGDEPIAPYQRPPLSKAYLLGEVARERLLLRPEQFYAENDITMHLGHAVDAIDRDRRRVCIGRDTIPYDRLLLAVGARPKCLPEHLGGALEGVHTLRNLADIDALQAHFRPGAQLLVIGGGYIGLEVAAVARKRQLQVTLVEAAERILCRVASSATAEWFRRLHLSRGVVIREKIGIARLLPGPTGRVGAAELSSGEQLEADLVIAGIGIDPATELAARAGLAIDNGIATDGTGHTSDARILAAGDCASTALADGRRLRLESVGNAIDQGALAARNIMGADEPYVPRPWFWSDQYECKLQIAGLNSGYDRVIARPGENSASFWYLRGDRLLAVDAVNDPRAYMVGKRLIEGARSPPADLLAAPGLDLRQLLHA